jgi:membrane anchored protein
MKLRLACILGILALAFSGTAFAQSQPVQQSGVEASLSGTVVSSTVSSLVIRDENGVEQSFDVDTSSTVPSGLMSGSRVTVRFHNMDGGRRHVASVMATDAGTSLAPTTPTAAAPVATEPVAPPPAAAPSTRVQEPIAPSSGTAGDRLPDTASEMPLLALAGLMTLAAGLVLRELRRRAA